MHSSHVLVGESAPICELREDLSLAAQCLASTLITGEPGVGKMAVAQSLHERGGNGHSPMRVVDCASASEARLEFELSRAGTLLLARVDRLSPALQAGLTDFLTRNAGQGPRLVSTGHGDIFRLVENGQFGEDLYYRLNVIHLRVPSLRTRPADVRILLSRCLAEVAKDRGCAAPERSAGVDVLLSAYAWPGNLRELQSVAAALVDSRGARRIRVRDLPLPIRIREIQTERRAERRRMSRQA